MYEAVLEDHSGLVKSIALRYRKMCAKDPAVSYDDILQAGALGLILTAASFVPKQGTTFRSAAKWKIIQEIRRALGLRNDKPTRADLAILSLDEPLLSEENGDTFGDMIADNNLPEMDEAIITDEIRTSVRESLERLTDPNQRRLMECILEDKNISEAAKEMGIGLNRAVIMYRRTLYNLRRDRKLREGL